MLMWQNFLSNSCRTHKDDAHNADRDKDVQQRETNSPRLTRAVAVIPYSPNMSMNCCTPSCGKRRSESGDIQRSLIADIDKLARQDPLTASPQAQPIHTIHLTLDVGLPPKLAVGLSGITFT
jgi:hypothetical protein